MKKRIEQQLAFLNEIEKLKLVYRRNRTVDRSRFENSAEHSWHLALIALVMAEHANVPTLDLLKVVTMLLIHDLVEIDAGDTWIFDPAAVQGQHDREEVSAKRLFGLLPADQAAQFYALWQEFEARETPEAQYAVAIDALQPMMNHLLSGLPEDAELPPSTAEVKSRKRHIALGSQPLWELALHIIDESAARGLYQPVEEEDD